MNISFPRDKYPAPTRERFAGTDLPVISRLPGVMVINYFCFQATSTNVPSPAWTSSVMIFV
jgi:hypothetical protein